FSQLCWAPHSTLQSKPAGQLTGDMHRAVVQSISQTPALHPPVQAGGHAPPSGAGVSMQGVPPEGLEEAALDQAPLDEALLDEALLEALEDDAEDDAETALDDCALVDDATALDGCALVDDATVAFAPPAPASPPPSGSSWAPKTSAHAVADTAPNGNK